MSDLVYLIKGIKMRRVANKVNSKQNYLSFALSIDNYTRFINVLRSDTKWWRYMTPNTRSMLNSLTDAILETLLSMVDISKKARNKPFNVKIKDIIQADKRDVITVDDIKIILHFIHITTNKNVSKWLTVSDDSICITHVGNFINEMGVILD